MLVQTKTKRRSANRYASGRQYFHTCNKSKLLVENTRVGQITDYDKLSLEVWTNGTIAPDDAVSFGAKILNEHLNLFIDLSDNAKDTSIMVEKKKARRKKFWK